MSIRNYDSPQTNEKKSEFTIGQEIEFEDNKHFWSRNSEQREKTEIAAKNAVKDASARNWRCGTS